MAYLKPTALLLIYFFVFCPKIHALSDTIPKFAKFQSTTQPICFLDEKEIDIASLKKIDPCTIEKIDFINAEEAAKTYGVKGRFGVFKIISRKKPIYLNGIYSLTLYITTDSSLNVRQQNLMDNNLDNLFQHIVKDYPNSYLIIDDLRFSNKNETWPNLEKESQAFSLLHSNFIADSISKSIAEAIFYCFKIYKSGRFYFSGSNFKNVISCNAADINCVRNNFNLCTIGTVITIEGCQYRNSNDGTEVINKSIKLN